MSVTVEQIKQLREATGLGMMVCKKALVETGGNMEEAVNNLRKQGEATAAKRAGKSANEGKIVVTIGPDSGLIYEVNCETDFVARNEDFLAFVDELGKLLEHNKPADIARAKELTSEKFGGETVEARIVELMGKIGEKITFRRFHVEEFDPSKERLASYVHGNGRLGVIVKLAADKQEALDKEDVAELGKELAMQITATNPLAPSREQIPAEIIEREREIYLTQVQNSGKPEKIWDKIVEGKLGKFYKESVLVEQPYIREPDRAVKDRIAQTEKAVESGITVRGFVRYELGSEE